MGETVVATSDPQQDAALAAIEELGLELQVILNKGAVMILPYGRRQGIRARRGTAGTAACRGTTWPASATRENDRAFLDLCECGAATANALARAQGRL